MAARAVAAERSVWDRLGPELVERIASLLDPSEVAGTLRLLNKDAARALNGPQHRNISLSRPFPKHAFATYWAGPCGRADIAQLTLAKRRRLLCSAAANGDLETLGALIVAGAFPYAEAINAAAAAGQGEVCEVMVRSGCAFDAPSLLLAAARAGQREVCWRLLLSGLCQWSEQAVSAAALSGHLSLCDWLIDLKPHGEKRRVWRRAVAWKLAGAAKTHSLKEMELEFFAALEEVAVMAAAHGRISGVDQKKEQLLLMMLMRDELEEEEEQQPPELEHRPEHEERPQQQEGGQKQELEHQPEQEERRQQQEEQEQRELEHRPGQEEQPQQQEEQQQELAGPAGQQVQQPQQVRNKRQRTCEQLINLTRKCLRGWARGDVLAAAAGSPTADWAAKVEWLEEMGFHKTRAALTAAAAVRSDGTARLDWLQARGGYPPPNKDVANAAAVAGNVAAVKQLAAAGIRPEWRFGRSIGAGGHLEVMQALREAGHRDVTWVLGWRNDFAHHADVVAWVAEATQHAQHATFGIKSFDERASPWLFAQAARTGSLALLSSLRERGYAWSGDAYSEAARAGSAEALCWLAEKGCPQPADGVPYVIALGNEDPQTMRCLRKLGLAFGEDTFTDGLKRSSRLLLAELRWMLAEGCPVDWARVEQVLGDVPKMPEKRRQQVLALQAEQAELVQLQQQKAAPRWWMPPQ